MVWLSFHTENSEDGEIRFLPHSEHKTCNWFISSMNKRNMFFLQDWPDNYKMSSEAFEQYAATIEQDDFEDDVRNLSSSLHQLVGARRDTIKKLRASAEYLDSIWVR